MLSVGGASSLGWRDMRNSDSSVFMPLHHENKGMWDASANPSNTSLLPYHDGVLTSGPSVEFDRTRRAVNFFHSSKSGAAHLRLLRASIAELGLSHPAFNPSTLLLLRSLPPFMRAANLKAMLSKSEVFKNAERRGISGGGEMRRVSIGLELVARPDVLILAELTSGLDSVSVKKVGEVLRALANDKENPTAWKLDDLCVRADR
ncbi:hypothetical protein FOMPIDRAFT_1050157 [Fomitopsis schrenkii]|uniref:ABC transporter domain-containing protein n=1 Tax=Fomitopsis schrenkii TaxID=2126942 RepID=S8E911_FOMSC|nr:hypothetical protein FOMPIDRAFT_1050157 [Fomitopsis schrenkii]